MQRHADTEVDENRVGIVRFVFMDLDLVKHSEENRVDATNSWI
jgi:hypothetical protein